MTDPDCSTRLGKPKALGDTEFQGRGLQQLLRNWSRIKNGPGLTVRQHRPGPDHATSTDQVESEAAISLPSNAGLTDHEHHIDLLRRLDAADQRYTASRSERRGLMVRARAAGVSCRDIGIVLGISEQSARDQIRRAKAAGYGS